MTNGKTIICGLARAWGSATAVMATAVLVTAVLATAALTTAALAEDTNVYTNSNTNQHGMNLPAVPTPSGQDQLRTSGGTTCSSSMARNGAYLDLGAIGSQDRSAAHVGSLYARIVIPLGRKPKRIDCAQLYALEIERLRMEMELMRMGLGEMTAMPQDVNFDDPSDEG